MDRDSDDDEDDDGDGGAELDTSASSRKVHQYKDPRMVRSIASTKTTCTTACQVTCNVRGKQTSHTVLRLLPLLLLACSPA